MQRQLRLGDILDDYCPRERRLTNHAVVAMVGDTVKQTRCTTCDAEHEYKQAKVPRQRKKDTPSALTAQIMAGGPKRVAADRQGASSETPDAPNTPLNFDDSDVTQPAGDSREGPDIDDIDEALAAVQAALGLRRGSRAGQEGAVPLGAGRADEVNGEDDVEGDDAEDARGNVGSREPEGPAHRRLIRATLPRLEGQPPASRPAPDFTIRTPTGGRPNRFRARNQGPRGAGGAPPFGNQRSGQPGNAARGGGGAQRNGNNRPPQANQSRRFDGRKRSK